jgi:hypothetical protein
VIDGLDPYQLAEQRMKVM